MKRPVLFLGIILAASAITWAVPKQEKQATLILNRAEMEMLYSIIDESATPGSVRKPLLDKIMRSYQSAFPQQPQVKPDSTKPKKQ